jgi:integrase
LPTCRTDEQADERAKQLATLAERMTLARVEPELARKGLERVAAAPAGAKLKVQCALVDELIAGWRPQSACPSFGSIVERWGNGELHRKFPAFVRKRHNAKAALANLRLYVLPVIGDRPVDAITLDDCDAIANSLGHLRQGSRRQVLAPLKTLLDYCVRPLGLIERSPLPPKWLPKNGKPRTLQWLYPSEDAKLMACTAVPLWQRMLFGYLIREGGREAEPLCTTIDMFDFVEGRNTCRLSASLIKTKVAKFWQLQPGTARALQRWFKRRHARSSDLAFVNDRYSRIDADHTSLPELLRDACRLAGIDRPELYTTTADSRQLCVHDLRRSFVTVMLALGRSERWISQRTGHLSSTELRGYEKAAASFAELNVGDFLPLDEAIPELRSPAKAAPSIDQQLAANTRNHTESPVYIVELPPVPQARDITENAVVSGAASGHKAPQSAIAGQTMADRMTALEARLAVLTATAAPSAELIAQLSNSLAVHVAAAVTAQLRGTKRTRKANRK